MHIPSLGYILGDEGSGAHIAKKFIAAYLYREMPGDLKSKIDTKAIKKEDVIQNLYTPLLHLHILPVIWQRLQNIFSIRLLSSLVKNCFAEFLERHICRYTGFREIPMHCTGSIAYNFSYLLKEAAAWKRKLMGRHY
jgi:glucosamine kinase